MSKSTHTVTLSVLTAFLFGLVFLPLALPVQAQSIGAWNATTSYPVPTTTPATGITGNSCAIAGGYMYCVGGALYPPTPAPTDSTYYAPVSSSGIGPWTAATAYPSNVYLPSCVISGGYIYCVGGLTAAGEVGSAVYSAPVSSTGIGSWTSTTAYPTAIEATSCVASGGYITCVGGLVGIGSNTWAAYSATLSSGSVGTWTSTTHYPGNTEGESCVALLGNIYCIGGQFNPTESDYLNDSVWYATLSSGVIGTWTAYTNYPVDISFAACTDPASAYIYCIGGYSGTASSGVYIDTIAGAPGTWSSATTYPIPVETAQCGTSGGYIYCVGGEWSNAYYAQLGSSTTTTSTTTTTTSTTTSSTTTSSSSIVTQNTPKCPSTSGGVIMPVGATFGDNSGNTWVAPGGTMNGGTYSSYFFAGPQSSYPPPMVSGWGGVYGTYAGQQGWIVSFYCTN